MRAIFFITIFITAVACTPEDLSEEELTEQCKALTLVQPQLREVETSGFKNEGMVKIETEKMGGVWRIIVKSEVLKDRNLFPDQVYMENFYQINTYYPEDLLVNNSDPLKEYWIIEAALPSTNIRSRYEIIYECENGSTSGVSFLTVESIDLCQSHEEWGVWVIDLSSAYATNIPKSVSTIDVALNFERLAAGEAGSLSYIPYDKITSATAYVSSGSYTFVYEDFIQAFLKDGSEKFSYFSSIPLEIYLHEITGISAEEWESWPHNNVVVDVELKICGQTFYPSAQMEPGTERIRMLNWNPN
ncbi:hypothetical protein JKA74_14205 [Marivirga sp. S37H4]|uniref:Uncharacterized protein n=1 Tax=Marivirga aurantiaca TaxID=2802615 RepID=A0A934X031_9BACT|nr:hypothetical protein [Marivirga aurantiaca]MBK6266194.1 hypothetical protein [Marivirga aurantiaca]